MSKVINFNARDFRFDETCRSLDGDEVNAGMRAFVSLSFGNAEVWEIGDWCWTWSQIRRDIKLEKNTDYVFRFAMEDGVCDTDDAVTLAHIAPKNDWEGRYTYPLDHNRFMPVICKRDGEGLLRIFELPFNTGDEEDWVILLVAQHAVTKYFAPVNSEVLEGMEDISYKDWWASRNNRNGSKSAAVPDAEVIPVPMLKKFVSALKNGVLRGDGVSIEIESQEFDENELAARLSKMGDGSNLSFENITVHSCILDKGLSVGDSTDGSNLSLECCTLTSLAASMIIAKLGDGCNISLDNVTVTEEGIDKMFGVGSEVDGNNFQLDNVTLPKRVMDLIYAKMGDGCNISTDNCTVI